MFAPRLDSPDRTHARLTMDLLDCSRILTFTEKSESQLQHSGRVSACCSPCVTDPETHFSTTLRHRMQNLGSLSATSLRLHLPVISSRARAVPLYSPPLRPWECCVLSLLVSRGVLPEVSPSSAGG